MSLRCLSKKEKCEKHKRCDRKAEAKKDHRIERGVPGHGPTVHGQLSYGTVPSGRCPPAINREAPAWGSGRIPQAGLCYDVQVCWLREAQGRLSSSLTLRLRFLSPQIRPDRL